MLRALWYLIKIMVLVGLAVAVYVQPGNVTIDWNDYHILVPLGVLGFAALMVLVIVSVISEWVTRISLWPENLARARDMRRRAKGYRALMQSLSAAAIGDRKTAYYLAHRAQKFLPEDESGLPLLLQAQSMSKESADPHSNDPYRLLLKNADTALLGLQGLTQNAILAGDFEQALILARQALAAHPKNYILLRAVYDLEVRNRLWNDALVTLHKAVRRKVIDEATATRDRIAIYLVLGDMAHAAARPSEAQEFFYKAYKLDHGFAPSVVRLVTTLQAQGSRRKALSILEKAWKADDHPSYIALWRALMPPAKSGKAANAFVWFQSVVKLHPNSQVGYIALAQAAIDDELWGDARQALVDAEKHGQSAAIYKLWITIEEKTTNRPDVIRQWLDRAYNAPKGGAWVCPKTGRSFDDWQAIIEPEGVFNTLAWNTVSGATSAPKLSLE